MDTISAKFTIGQTIHHKIFNYRGIIVDVDPAFQHADEWYQLLAKTRPPKDHPWYHVLVDDTDYMTYVAEQNLEEDFDLDQPISHPELEKYFIKAKDGHYKPKEIKN